MSGIITEIITHVAVSIYLVQILNKNQYPDRNYHYNL